MKGYWRLVGAIFGSLLAVFLIFAALGNPLFDDPSGVAGMIGKGGLPAAAIGVFLLIIDVFLPVPSSLVMVAHGALFGVWIGTLLSMVGQMGAALVGYAVGRAGGPMMERMVPPEDRVRGEKFIERWGALAMVVSRPIPLFAETVAILAGTARIGWVRSMVAAAAGSLPPALLYALTGAVARDFGSAALMFGFVMLMTAVFWLVGRKLGEKQEVAGRP
jgi:uncharacterized membrane protein YdjX (TVP38/TMEM64 family)